jgi:hypothetical protein
MADNENEFDDFDIGPQSDEMAWDEMDDADNRDFPTDVFDFGGDLYEGESVEETWAEKKPYSINPSESDGPAETKPRFGEANQSEWDEQPDFIEPCYYDDEDGDQEYRAYMYGSGRY